MVLQQRDMYQQIAACISSSLAARVMSVRASRCVGILREVKNKWERRAALTPAHVQQLVAQGIQVLVQPSDRRVFPDQEYAEAGAVVQEDLSPANVILGVKEVPISKLLPNK